MEKAIENRIERVINNLLPAASLKDRLNPPQALRDRMAYYHTPGVSIAVINDFEIEWARGLGLCDARSQKPVTTETLFQAGSISKPVFALGVMRLVQEGTLSLDEDIHSYLSSWHIPANQGWQPRITLRQILSHTAGLTVAGFPGYQASETLPAVTQVLNGESPANTARVEVNLLPGTRFRYSGGGITVAQQAIVDFLKKPFPQIMHELVLEPLGMSNSTYAQPLHKRWAKRAATAHPSKGIPLKGKFRTYPEMAAAGLWTTATDLAKAGVELLRILHDQKERPFLSKAMVEAMLTPQLDYQKIGAGLYIGLGFFCDGKEDEFSFGHYGSDEGFVAQMQIFKNLGKGAVIMVNSNEGSPLLDEITRAIAKEYGWPGILPEEKTTVVLENLQDYTGLYTSKAGTQFRISLLGEGLALLFQAQPPLPVFPSSDTEFFTEVLNTELYFEKDEQSRIVALTVSQEGHQIRAEKQATSSY